MENRKIVSLHTKRLEKLKEEEEKLFKDEMLDIYLPYKEVDYWLAFTAYGLEYVKEKSGEMGPELSKLFTDCLEQFSVDMTLYKEHGDTLEKFRFMFTFFEVFVLSLVMNKFKEEYEQYSKENRYYAEKLGFVLAENQQLLPLLSNSLPNSINKK